MLWPIALTLLTAVSLIFAFPKTDFWFLSWIAFIPFFFALDKKDLRSCFFLSYLCGVVFFAGTFYWFIHVTIIGAILLSLYCALYFVLFGYAIYQSKEQSSWLRLLFLSSFWVCLEYARAHLFSGFGWALLGHSQYKNLALIQIADLSGVYGISFLVMMVNITLKCLLDSFIKTRASVAIKPLFITALLFFVVIYYGNYQLNKDRLGQSISIAVIQANIPQELKWHEPYWPEIMDKYKIITQRAALDNPDLIIWPETSFPGYLGKHDELFGKLQQFIDSLDIPLLLGTVVKAGKDEYYNSAVLINEDGRIIEQYNKLHLVPFGEYIPFRKFFPFLSQIVPIADFTSGRDFVQFPIPKTADQKLATLICFEDSVPHLSRTFTKRGSNLLVNITNDAWFKDTKEPFLHLQTSVFRAVENRRALVRAANTGISGFIDENGEIKKIVKDQEGKPTYVLGFVQDNVVLLDESTFYSRFGDLFSVFCLFFVILTFLSSYLNLNSKFKET